MNLEVLEVDRAQIEFDQAAGKRAGGGIAAFGAQQVDQVAEQGSGDDVGDDVERRAGERVADLLDPVAAVAKCHRRGAERAHRLGLGRAG